jgi:hypothetical protein
MGHPHATPIDHARMTGEPIRQLPREEVEEELDEEWVRETNEPSGTC